MTDSTPPTLSNVRFASSGASASYAKLTDNVTVSFTASEALETSSLTVTVAGVVVTATNTGGNNFTATRSLSTSPPNDGLLSFSVVYRDVAGNVGNTVTTAAGTVTFGE